jgi:thimet oligopeptidase
MRIYPNPKFNQPVDFQSITTEDIKSAALSVIERANSQIGELTGTQANEKNFENTLKSLDEIYSGLSDIFSIIYLLGFVHPDNDIRNEAQAKISELEKFENEISLNEAIFEAVQQYSRSEEAQNLSGYKKRYLTKVLQNFESSGFLLSKEKRDELKALKNRLADVGLVFDTNISEYQDFLFVTEEEIEGLPEDYKEARKQEGGTYKIDLSYPSYRPFMQLSVSDEARRKLYIKYLNRAAEKNPPVLLEMIDLRQQIARMLNFQTFAEFQLANKMAKTTEKVWKFEHDLIDKVKTKAEQDYAELAEIKSKTTPNASEKEIKNWESAFYNNVLMKEKYEVDNQKVKEYFEMNNVINGLFRISETLFDIQFVELSEKSVWQEDVRFFAIYSNKQEIAHFYLDLYPRDNKYGHAACFPLYSGRETENGYNKPLASLVCNFPKPTPQKPSLLPHDDVVTFFHEFGHLLHSLLTTSPLGSMAGTSVANDFVETPSQLFENWAWNYEALQMFSLHYKTGEVLPKELFTKMWDSRNVGSGLFALQQIFYGLLDMTFYDKFDPKSGQDTSDVVKNLQDAISLYPFVEGTRMEASFGHLNGYAAGYYGYLWALVYAQDIFSEFTENGIFDTKTGKKLKTNIISKGSTSDEYEMVCEFLGREPNNSAFLKSLGL